MSLDVYLECDHCETVVYSQNITHNLGKMAEEAGIYKHCWRPEEINVERAGQLIQPLEEGLTKLQSNPEHFKQFNAPNRWGMYEHFVTFVEDYLDACKRHPKLRINVSR